MLLQGIRAWGRTGCDGSGANCQTGACNGGLVCNDGGITSGVILSEYGYADFGQFGGQRTSWDLSHVSACECYVTLRYSIVSLRVPPCLWSPGC